MASLIVPQPHPADHPPRRSMRLGYCTNVHSGADLGQVQAQLERYALDVRSRFCPQRALPVGLWFSATTADQLLSGSALSQFRAWLERHELTPLTLNGFPYGDFHQPVVKHAVYQPPWGDARRSDYTRQLVQVLQAILPDGVGGSISTLPLGWPAGETLDQMTSAARELLTMARYLDQHEAKTGRHIVLCLEPEPGCLLQRSADVVAFFQRFLFVGADAERAARYVGVCHDVCHAAVMFESQGEVLSAYQAAGIAVGKVQLSSALRVVFPGTIGETEQAAWRQLASFAEDRYLHQTVARRLVAAGEQPSQGKQWEDLPLALRDAGGRIPAGAEWRIHFHVPIYLAEIGDLTTTQQEILACLRHPSIQPSDLPLEVETYAWGVLPPPIAETDLAGGIARELGWAEQRLAESLGGDAAGA